MMKETDNIVIDIICPNHPKPIIQEPGETTDTNMEESSSSSSPKSNSKSVGGGGGVVVVNFVDGGQKEKRKAKSGGSKKPPKPPRPPTRGLSLDAADQRLIKELSEIALIKRAARIQRLKRMKAAAINGSSSSFGNVAAVLFTLVFCLLIIFRGCHPPAGILARNKSVPEIAGNIVMVGEEESILLRREIERRMANR